MRRNNWENYVFIVSEETIRSTQHSLELRAAHIDQLKISYRRPFLQVVDDVSRILEFASDRLTPPRFRHTLATKNIDHTVIAFMTGIFIQLPINF